MPKLRQNQKGHCTLRIRAPSATFVAVVCCAAVWLVSLRSPADGADTTDRAAIGHTLAASDTLTLAFSSAHVLITAGGLDSKDFADSVFADSAKIVELTGARLEGAQVHVGLAPNQSLRAQARFGFAFVQYLTDDRPAPELPFRYRTDWVLIPTTGANLRLPTFVHPEDGAPNLSQLLGHANYQAMSTAVGQQFFERLRRESLTIQSGYYRELLQDSTIAACCPEYIAQARRFLEKRSTDFRTTSDLGLELYQHDSLLRLEILSGHRIDATLVLVIAPVDR